MRKVVISKEYILSKINKTENGCWEWQGNISAKGYGYILVREGGKRKNYRAHRMSYTLFTKNPEVGMFICHKCDNRKCVNPEHLFEGTAKDNTYDMMRKGRNKTDQLNRGNFVGRAVEIEGKRYNSMTEASAKLGVSGGAIKKRIMRGMKGYRFVEV